MSILNQSPEAALVSIDFLMDAMSKTRWQCSIGPCPWGSCTAALVLAIEPSCRSRRLLDSLPSDKMDRVALLSTMANLGYVAQPLEIRLKDIEPRLLPCLFVENDKGATPSVILDLTDKGYKVYDSHLHKVVFMPPSSSKGIAYFFTPYDSNAQPTSAFMRTGSGNSWFFAMIRRFSSSFWHVLGICLAINIFALAPALFIMLAYDRVISPSNPDALLPIVGGVLLALAAEWKLRDIRAEMLAWMTARLDNIVGSRIFAHLIGLPAALIEQASISAQVARIKTFEAVRDFFSSAVFLSFLEIPFVAIALGVVAWIAGPLVAVPLLMIGAYALLFAVMRHKIMATIRLTAKASSARQQFVIETFEKLPSLRLNGLAPAWEKKFSQLSGRESVLNFNLGFLGTISETLAHALTIIAAVLTIGYGAQLIWAGTMSTGVLVACMILVWRILLPFYSLCTMIPRLEQLRNSILQVNSLMELEGEEEVAKGSSALPAIKGHIRLEGISLRYDEDGETLINGLHLDLKPGQIAAITGRNGTGKSSILKIIKNLYRPLAGTVKIDGFDIRQMNVMELRRQIAYVPQNADFFPGTIAENIIISNPFAGKKDIEKALKMADAWEEIDGLMDNDINDLNMTPALAARLSLARAYIQNASILLIDELPNAVLNGPAGKNLKEYLTEPSSRRTVVLVTHRGDLSEMAHVTLGLSHYQPPVVTAKNPTPDKKTQEAA